MFTLTLKKNEMDLHFIFAIYKVLDAKRDQKLF